MSFSLCVVGRYSADAGGDGGPLQRGQVPAEGRPGGGAPAGRQGLVGSDAGSSLRQSGVREGHSGGAGRKDWDRS